MLIKDEELDGRKLLTSSKIPLVDQFLVYFDKEWEIYEIFQNKMLYLDEEPEGRDIDTDSEHFQVDKVPLPSQKNWETSKIKDKRIPYMDVGSKFVVKGDLEEGCFSRDKFDAEDL